MQEYLHVFSHEPEHSPEHELEHRPEHEPEHRPEQEPLQSMACEELLQPNMQAGRMLNAKIGITFFAIPLKKYLREMISLLSGFFIILLSRRTDQDRKSL